MPHLGTQEEVAAHLQQALRDRDRWILLGIGDRGKLTLYCLLALLLADGHPEDSLASCTIDYLDLAARDRLDARLLTFPREFLSPEGLHTVLSAAGFTKPLADEDVVSLGGTPESLGAVAGFIDTCVHEHFAPQPGVN